MKNNNRIYLILVIILIVFVGVVFISIRTRNVNFVNESTAQLENGENSVRNNLGSGYQIVGENVYWNICSKPSCITCIDNCVARKLENVDIDTFRIESYEYAKDVNNKYHKYEIIK